MLMCMPEYVDECNPEQCQFQLSLLHEGMESDRVPGGVKNIVKQCISVDPRRRPSMKDVAAMLQKEHARLFPSEKADAEHAESDLDSALMPE